HYAKDANTVGTCPDGQRHQVEGANYNIRSNAGNDCPLGMEQDAGLCYPVCPNGWKAIGPVCWEPCPPGFDRDDGFTCWKNGDIRPKRSYNRGPGFGWQFGDPLDLGKATGRCENVSGGPGSCEQHLLVIYPKCKPGFVAVGCCICQEASCPKPDYPF